MCAVLVACPADDVFIEEDWSVEPTTSETTSTATTSQPAVDPTTTRHHTNDTPGVATFGPCDAEYPPGELPSDCPLGSPVDLDTELCRGFTPEDAIAKFDRVAFPLIWASYTDSPSTVLRLDVAYVGGGILEGPGGPAGAAGLGPWWICEDGVMMEVEVTLTSDDGWLQWTMPMLITGVLGEDLVMSGFAAIDGNAGTLASQPLVVDGEEVALSEIRIMVTTMPGFDVWMFANAVGGPLEMLIGRTFEW
jgi:hypothetical protein